MGVCALLRLCKQEDGREMCVCMCVCAYVCLNRREGGKGVCEFLHVSVSVFVEGGHPDIIYAEPNKGVRKPRPSLTDCNKDDSSSTGAMEYTKRCTL